MRMRWLTISLLSASVAMVLLGSDATAQKKKPKELTEEQEAEVIAQNVKDFALAYQLVELGRKNKAPEALVTAAGLFRKLAKVEMKPATEEPVIENDPKADKAEPVEVKEPDYEAEANALFAEALFLAKQEHKVDLTALVNNAKSRVEYRAAIGGPKQVMRAITPGQKHSYHVKIRPAMNSNFGFRSSAPCYVSISRTDNEASGGTAFGTFANASLMPGINRPKVAFVNITIHNRSNISGQYQFVLD